MKKCVILFTYSIKLHYCWKRQGIRTNQQTLNSLRFPDALNTPYHQSIEEVRVIVEAGPGDHRVAIRVPPVDGGQIFVAVVTVVSWQVKLGNWIKKTPMFKSDGFANGAADHSRGSNRHEVTGNVRIAPDEIGHEKVTTRETNADDIVGGFPIGGNSSIHGLAICLRCIVASVRSQAALSVRVPLSPALDIQQIGISAIKEKHIATIVRGLGPEHLVHVGTHLHDVEDTGVAAVQQCFTYSCFGSVNINFGFKE